MTREEAAMCKEIARELRQQLPEQVNLADLMGAEAFMGSMWGWDDPAPYVMDRAACWLEALANSNPQLDSNGLMPCGCGGKVDVAFYPRWAGKPDLYRVDCFSCRVGTRPCQTAEQAKAAWNTAMGWKGGAE